MDIEASWMRGGTSKCWVFEASALAQAGSTADSLLPRLFGSPDAHQRDGVGGGTSTTSKAVILERSERDGIDVDFTFAQVGIEEATVDWGSNCGNCSTTAGLFAVEHGWVPLGEPATRVTTYNTNTGQVIVQRVATPGGRLPEAPTGTMPGAVFPGHDVGLGFVDPAGRTTGATLPTGSAQHVFTRDGRAHRASVVDAGAPLVVLSAENFGLRAADHAQWVHRVEPHLGVLDELRRAAAVAIGMADAPAAAARAVPKICVVGPSPTEDADLQVLALSMGRPHPAMPITSSVALTVASWTAGTLVEELVRGRAEDGLRLRTPAGVLRTFTDRTGADVLVGVGRTARTLATTVLHLSEAGR
ncbi:PrpF domain-containing protein [Kocuria sp. CPCC 205258]|uniref:PrpF domain-containing protein n=1 Tax=Kocuria sp. CPCC 205258 TaxID=3073552 RepID=UPI0034D55E38